MAKIRAFTNSNSSMWGACALAVSSLVGCDRNGASEDTNAPPTTARVADDPSRFVGKQLTLVGEVDSVYSDRAFELEGNEPIFDSSILVVSRSPIRIAGRMVQDDERVSVTGTVRNFIVADLEREIGWDLDPELEVDWRSRPAFVAQSISTLAEQARWSESEPERQGVIVSLVPMLYVAEPSALAGQKIELDAIPVHSRMGKALWLGSSHTDQMLATAADAAMVRDIQAGERVDVAGTIREMPKPSEAISRWNLQPGLTEQIEEEPIYIEVQSIEQSEKPRGTAQRDKANKSGPGQK